MTLSAQEPQIVKPVRLAFGAWLRRVYGPAVNVRQHLSTVQTCCQGAKLDEEVFCYKLNGQLVFISLAQLHDFDIEQPGLEKPSEQDLWEFFEERFPTSELSGALDTLVNGQAETVAKRRKRTDRSPGRPSLSTYRGGARR